MSEIPNAAIRAAVAEFTGRPEEYFGPGHGDYELTRRALAAALPHLTPPVPSEPQGGEGLALTKLRKSVEDNRLGALIHLNREGASARIEMYDWFLRQIDALPASPVAEPSEGERFGRSRYFDLRRVTERALTWIENLQVALGDRAVPEADEFLRSALTAAAPPAAEPQGADVGRIPVKLRYHDDGECDRCGDGPIVVPFEDSGLCAQCAVDELAKRIESEHPQGAEGEWTAAEIASAHHLFGAVLDDDELRSVMDYAANITRKRLAEMSEAITRTLSAWESTEYVGGIDSREAWRVMQEALAPYRIEYKAMDVGPAPVQPRTEGDDHA